MASGLCFRPSARPLSSVGQSCGLLIRRSWVRAPQGVPHRPRPRKGPRPYSFLGRRQRRPPTILPTQAFGLRDGCWNRARSGGTNPPEINDLDLCHRNRARVDQGSIRASSDSQMTATVTQPQRHIRTLSMKTTVPRRTPAPGANRSASRTAISSQDLLLPQMTALKPQRSVGKRSPRSTSTSPSPSAVPSPRNRAGSRRETPTGGQPPRRQALRTRRATGPARRGRTIGLADCTPRG